MKTKSTVILLTSIGVAAIAGFIVYNKYQNRTATEGHVSEMFSVATEVKNTSFAGMSVAQVYDRFKTAADKDVRRMTAILKKGKEATAADLAEFKILYDNAIEKYLAV